MPQASRGAGKVDEPRGSKQPSIGGSGEAEWAAEHGWMPIYKGFLTGMNTYRFFYIDFICILIVTYSVGRGSSRFSDFFKKIQI